MLVPNAADLIEEISKIGRLREAGKLGRVVQPNVDDFPNAGFQKAFEKAFRRRFGEADC